MYGVNVQYFYIKTKIKIFKPTRTFVNLLHQNFIIKGYTYIFIFTKYFKYNTNILICSSTIKAVREKPGWRAWV